MKKLVLVPLMLAVALIALTGCTQPAADATISYEDGNYRGAFIDGGVNQVSLQITLENNIVTAARFRHLEYRGVNYLREENDAKIIGLREQHEQLLEHLIGKDIRESIDALYTPGNIVTDEVDGLTGATLRSGKIISALRDALNRGVYSR